jgi:hypothetical protein
LRGAVTIELALVSGIRLAGIFLGWAGFIFSLDAIFLISGGAARRWAGKPGGVMLLRVKTLVLSSAGAGDEAVALVIAHPDTSLAVAGWSLTFFAVRAASIPWLTPARAVVSLAAQAGKAFTAIATRQGSASSSACAVRGQ